MSAPLPSPNLQQTDADLAQLLQEVNLQQGYLAHGTSINKGALNIQDLLDTRVTFGNPYDTLILLTEATFKLSGSELNEIYKQQMQQQYNFYYLTITVALIPKPSTRFWRLTCQLDFQPKGLKGLIIKTIFPTQQWRSVVNFGVGMNVGLDGNLDWKAAVDSNQIPLVADKLPAELRVKVENKNAFQGFICIPAFKYELGNPEILAVGEGNSFGYWRIEDEKIQQIGTAKFALVFKVPKEVKSITLEGKAWAEPDLNWLTADIRDVVGALSDYLKSIFQQGNTDRFARGIMETWTLDLPV